MALESDLFVSVKFVSRLLEIWGLWPRKKFVWNVEIRSFASLILSLAFFGMGVTEVTLHFTSFKDLAENMSVAVPIGAYSVKLVVFRMKRRKFFEMLDLVLLTPTFRPRTQKQMDFVQDMCNRCILLTKIYVGMCGVVMSLYAVLSLFSASVLPLKFSFEFVGGYYAMWLFQIGSILNCGPNTVYLDMLAVCFLSITISQLQILEDRIKQFANYSTVQHKEFMKDCIVHHNKIIEFLAAVEEVFNLFFLTQFMSSIFTICNIGFQLTNLNPMSIQFANMFCYFVTMILQLAIFCWFGNEILFRSLAIGDACYESNWLQAGTDMKRSLILVMTRANRQLAVTAGKFSILSLRSLTSIMRASYSYFALMQRLSKEDQF